MADTDVQVQFETKTVNTIRGTESMTIAKWEKDGWELVSQDPGKIRTQLVFRRPKPKPPWRLFAILGGILVVLAIVIVIGVNLSGDDDAEAAPASSSSAASSAQSAATSDEGSSDEARSSAPAEEPALTVDNSEDLASLLSGPADGQSVEKFAEEHAGQVIEFDGNIAAMAPHGSYTTRYDILIANGDYSEEHSNGGPNFQYRDVNVTNDLHFTGKVPDTIGIGDNVHVVARVGQYEEDTLLFLLEPVSTQVR
ncbi:DUF4839 domain-containing protein [Microbacterium horticulturae]|uniref:DUF4839 domain-containing protein n=1 Tax=Microbacterium horticulturae TaxID=3028316 RepID=A0ABY8BWP8_9MICO|nr:DUF4839 domain-containing protein [Microbacterium sp. KACC 23027]WEG08606.1 DUF4839 domain-containing protein [Microbacterium sp. KACC 23027]